MAIHKNNRETAALFGYKWYPLCGRGDGECSEQWAEVDCWECRAIEGLGDNE